MIFVFIILLVVSFIREKDTILNKKINLAVFLILTAIGIGLGVIRMIHPYIPSLAALIEKYIK